MQVIVLCYYVASYSYKYIPSEVHVIHNNLNFAFDSILVMSKIFGIVSNHISLMSLMIIFQNAIKFTKNLLT